ARTSRRCSALRSPKTSIWPAPPSISSSAEDSPKSGTSKPSSRCGWPTYVAQMANNLRDRIARRLDELPPNREVDFQSCANALLRQEYPTLSPGPAGADGGRDGETARAPEDAGIDLVCTIARGPESNLRNSLESAQKQGRPIQRVVFATSRSLTGK